ncbi:MAG: hypothetical protein AAGB01_03045, partial [Cyanobacteria bacterium P01_F01_bin.42]
TQDAVVLGELKTDGGDSDDSVSLDSLQWLTFSDTSAIASLCPECDAELQQINGCSGGACLVCGYSSCS